MGGGGEVQEKGEGVKPPKDEARAFSHAFVFP